MASIPSTHRTAVFFDGACPLCRKEIGWYRRRRGAEAIDWVDLSQVRTTYAAPDLLTADALKRFHVRLPDGRLVSGGGAFAELWARLPTFTLLGRVMRTRAMAPALELFYRGFLRFRPVLQRLMSSQVACSSRYPKWLERELRSDHAGETGAVSIYRGVLAVSKDVVVRDFARRHLETEAVHLALMEEILPPAHRSRLLPVWRAAGFVTGALPALVGSRAVYVTVDAVESFVDKHYGAQIDALAGYYEWRELRETLESCRADELEHRDEARRRAGAARGLIARTWARLVGLSSVAGVAVAKRV